MIQGLAEIARDWAIRCFGKEHVYNNSVRALRCVEEAVELAQAYDVPLETMLKLVKTVYARPKGDPYQEIGGVLLTVCVLCASRALNVEQVLLDELRRCLEKPPKEFAQRNQDKINLGLDA